jgi:protein-disulfide isomerase/uncharacterized membrane protein
MMVTPALNQKRFPVLFFLVLCVVGILVSIELTRVYYLARTDPDYHSFCAINEAFNCEVVALSPHATVFGVPLSVWGLAGYVFALIVGLSCLWAKEARGGILILLGIMYSVVSLYLIGVMALSIHSLCILCLVLDAVNFALLFVAINVVRQKGGAFVSTIRDDLLTVSKSRLAFIAVVGIALLALSFSYGRHMVTSIVPEANESEQSSQKQCECVLDAKLKSVSIKTGATSDGRPWFGAENPAVTVEEFTDYLCPHCRRAHLLVRKLISEQPDKMRIVHHHLPLDASCNPFVQRTLRGHEKSCELALVAICAGKQGRFFEVNDYLFQNADEIRAKAIGAREIAQSLELDVEKLMDCMSQACTKEELRRDIEKAESLHIEGTPAFVVNGKVFYGRIPQEVIPQTETTTAK